MQKWNVDKAAPYNDIVGRSYLTVETTAGLAISWKWGGLPFLASPESNDASLLGHAIVALAVARFSVSKAREEPEREGWEKTSRATGYMSFTTPTWRSRSDQICSDLVP
jgi:hypothetical protein